METWNPKRHESEAIAIAVGRILWFVALLLALPALIAGLLRLPERPVEAVLIVIAAMVVLLFSANELCGGPGVFR